MESESKSIVRSLLDLIIKKKLEDRVLKIAGSPRGKGHEDIEKLKNLYSSIENEFPK